MAGRFFDPAVRGNRPLEMSKPTYRELATNFTLWCKFVLLEEQVSEREFNEMSIGEKLDILQGEVLQLHSFPMRERFDEPAPNIRSFDRYPAR